MISRGIIGPLVFVGLQILQVIVWIIPGEVPQIAGGFLFGVPIGICLSLGGITVGSSISFLVSRILGVPFVRALFSEQQVQRMGKR